MKDEAADRSAAVGFAGTTEIGGFAPPRQEAYQITHNGRTEETVLQGKALQMVEAMGRAGFISVAGTNRHLRRARKTRGGGPRGGSAA